jgi:glycosyltransferase involved in cell wall biosynthesis
MKLSVPLSIHNRARLFGRALLTYGWQTLPPEEWEIVLVDDMSTEDQSAAYRPWLGRINLRHVYFDHTRHPLFKAKNPGWKPGMPKNWWKTPALTTNLGCHLSRAPFLGLFHPEILHAPENFEKAIARLVEKPSYLFGKVWLGSQDVNRWLDARPGWISDGWKPFLAASGAEKCRAFKDDELYWYCSFLPKEAVERIRGVDFTFMDGNSFEDCDFKERINLAGFPDVLDYSIQGVHQDHSDEKDTHRVRDQKWLDSEKRNFRIWRHRRTTKEYPNPANADIDWAASECVVKIVEYQVGSMEPVTA